MLSMSAPSIAKRPLPKDVSEMLRDPEGRRMFNFALEHPGQTTTYKGKPFGLQRAFGASALKRLAKIESQKGK